MMSYNNPGLLGGMGAMGNVPAGVDPQLYQGLLMGAGMFGGGGFQGTIGPGRRNDAAGSQEYNSMAAPYAQWAAQQLQNAQAMQPGGAPAPQQQQAPGFTPEQIRAMQQQMMMQQSIGGGGGFGSMFNNN